MARRGELVDALARPGLAIRDSGLVAGVLTYGNVDALRFYQRRGFAIDAVRCGAVDEARRTLKPHIPLTGNYGIPIRDEIELVRL